MATLRRFAGTLGFSCSVASRVEQVRGRSLVASYHSKWLVYCRWCLDKGHSVSDPSVLKVADYLGWFWEGYGLSLSCPLSSQISSAWWGSCFHVFLLSFVTV